MARLISNFIRLVAGVCFLTLPTFVAGQTPQGSSEAVLSKTVADLVSANHILVDQKVLDAFGHVSVRHPSNPDHFLLSRSMPPAIVGEADIVEYGLDGNAIDAPVGYTHFAERFIHAEIYRRRPDVNAVVHSHSPAVIPFGVTKVPLRPIYHMAAFLAP